MKGTRDYKGKTERNMGKETGGRRGPRDERQETREEQGTTGKRNNR
jgi:hypothetical protein